MTKEYKINEESLVKVRNFLGEIPHKYAKEIESFLFDQSVITEIEVENISSESNSVEETEVLNQ